MMKLTRAETRHTRKIIRILTITIQQLEALDEVAHFRDVFPKTTRRAWNETQEVLNRTRIRIAVRDASAA